MEPVTVEPEHILEMNRFLVCCYLLQKTDITLPDSAINKLKEISDDFDELKKYIEEEISSNKLYSKIRKCINETNMSITKAFNYASSIDVEYGKLFLTISYMSNYDFEN